LDFCVVDELSVGEVYHLVEERIGLQFARPLVSLGESVNVINHPTSDGTGGRVPAGRA
jgi:hypothetical protein